MVEIIKFANGVTVALEKMPFVRSVAFGIFVKNGSRNETKATSGISHFIEHMMFKGTENRTAKQIADEVDSIGGQINAYTTKEYTCYYTRTLDTHFDTALDILADMYFNSLFDNEEIKKELNVILEEINMYEDSPEDLVYDMLQYNIWKNDPLGFPILGKAESISCFDHDIIKKYYNEHYRTDNTVLAVAGSFDRNDVLKKLERYFGSWKSEGSVKKDYKHVEYFKCKIKKEKDIEQIHLSLCFPGISLGADETYDLAAVNTILGGGMSSRLFQKVREENGLAYTVYSFGSSYINTGIFNIYAGLSPNHFDKVMKLILSEIEILKNEKISEKQLSKAKEQLKSNFLLSLENSSARASSIGKNMLLLNKIQTPDEIVGKIDAVTANSASEFINKIFDIDKMSISAVGKIDSISF